MFENAIDLVVAIISGLSIGFLWPRFLRANGTQPFIAGYLMLGALIIAGATRGLLTPNEGLLYPTGRALLAAIIISTSLWAIYGHQE